MDGDMSKDYFSPITHLYQIIYLYLSLSTVNELCEDAMMEPSDEELVAMLGNLTPPLPCSLLSNPSFSPRTDAGEKSTHPAVDREPDEDEMMAMMGKIHTLPPRSSSLSVYFCILRRYGYVKGPRSHD